MARTVSGKVVVRIFLPLDMTVVAEIMSVVAKAYGTAHVGDSGDPRVVDLVVLEDQLPRGPRRVEVVVDQPGERGA